MFCAFTVIMLLSTSMRWLWVLPLATALVCSCRRTIGETTRVRPTSNGITARVRSVNSQLYINITTI